MIAWLTAIWYRLRGDVFFNGPGTVEIVPADPPRDEQGKVLPICPYCWGWHPGECPRITRMRYELDGDGQPVMVEVWLDPAKSNELWDVVQWPS